MNLPLHVRSLRIFRLAIPMRFAFEHAAATRRVADPVVVELSAGAPYAHLVGYGETLARPYVTGESPATVEEDLRLHFAPRLEQFRPTSFVEALEFIESLPTQLGGRVVTAARAALELALLDLACRAFRRRPADVSGWMGLGGFGPPGCRKVARYSGVVLGRSRRKLRWLLRVQRAAGLRDFKLKVATPGWEDRLRWTYAALAGAITGERATLRVDANAGWTLEAAQAALPLLTECGVAALEQPLPDAQDADLPRIADMTSCALVADESLLTLGDAQRLVDGGAVRVLNVRLAKNGGLMPALRIARLAFNAGLDVQLGCLVGETSILTAAGIAFLEACPRVRFVEGGYGPLLLKRDVVARPLRMGWAGRVPALRGPGLGVVVIPERLEALALERPTALQF